MTKQNLPDDDTQTAWVHLVRVSQALLASVESDLRRAGFPPLAQYDALLELRRAGGLGLRPFELQHRMLLAQYSISRLVERLVRSGFVSRHDSEQDGRGQTLQITPKGEMLLNDMWPAYGKAIQTHFGAKLTASDIKQLKRLTKRLDKTLA